MSGRIIVMVSDLDDQKHGEISVHESAQKAARVVETLLESGFAQGRIRVFSGDEMGMQIAHRPVVALMSGDSSAQSGTVDDVSAEQPEDKPQLVRATSKTVSQAEVAATPFVQNGVRFSSLFRPA